MRTAIFFRNQKQVTTRKIIEENENLSFVLTIYKTIWCELLFVSKLIFFRATGKTVPENITIHMPQRTSKILLVRCGICIVMKK